MRNNEIISSLGNLHNLNKLDVLLLENIVKDYPYFNSAQILLAKKYQLENHPDFNKQLKMAAISSVDRKILYRFITSKPEEKPDVSDESVATEVAAEPIETVLEALSEKSETIIPPVVETEGQDEIIIEKKTEDKKIEINTSEQHTFAEWMKLMQGKTIKGQPSVTQPPAPTKQEIIQKTKPEEEKTINVEELAMKSLKEDENLISATLAEIYANQGKITRAIQLYEKLILQYPEKKDKFAQKITELQSKL